MTSRTVTAFTGNPTNPYVQVNSVSFAPGPPLLPGLYQVPSYPQRFPTRFFNKDVSIPWMQIQSVYDYERSGKMQL